MSYYETIYSTFFNLIFGWRRKNCCLDTKPWQRQPSVAFSEAKSAEIRGGKLTWCLDTRILDNLAVTTTFCCLSWGKAGRICEKTGFCSGRMTESGNGPNLSATRQFLFRTVWLLVKVSSFRWAVKAISSSAYQCEVLGKYKDSL